MPTAAKLIAAVCFALVGWFAAMAYIPQLPEGTNTGYFPEITAFIGFLMGWFTLGQKVRRGWFDGMAVGLRTSAFVVIWTLLVFGVYMMIRQSTKMTYDNAGEAVLDVPIQMIRYGKLMGSSTMIEVLVIGGILGGLITEFVGRRWR